VVRGSAALPPIARLLGCTLVHALVACASSTCMTLRGTQAEGR
jgi:hypothetical protein